MLFAEMFYPTGKQSDLMRGIFMDDRTSCEMKKEKFQYEVKDFEPVIRKKKRSKAFYAVIVLVSVILVGLVGNGLYKQFIYRENLTPEQACKRALSDCASHMFGADSYVVQNIDAADWYKILTKGSYDVKSSVKLKHLADFGLGIEDLVSGAGIKAETRVNTADKTFKGNMDITWTIITVPVLQYAADSEKMVITSPEFFKENILINKDELNFTGLTIGEIYKKLSGDEMEASAYRDMTVEDFFNLAEFTCSYTALEKKESFVVGGKEVTCEGYEIRAESELLVNPVIFKLYVNRDYQLISLESVYEYTDEENIKSGLMFDFIFSGEEHPSDKVKGSAEFYSGEDKIKGSLEAKTNVSDEAVKMNLTAELNAGGYTYPLNLTSDYDKTDNKFEIEVCQGTETDNVTITLEGGIENDRESATLEVDIDSLTFSHSGKELVTAGVKLSFCMLDSSEAEISVTADEPVLNLLEMTEDDFDSLLNQAMDRIGYYEQLIEDFF